MKHDISGVLKVMEAVKNAAEIVSFRPFGWKLEARRNQVRITRYSGAELRRIRKRNGVGRPPKMNARRMTDAEYPSIF